MCVKLLKNDIYCSYDPQGDFTEQTKGCTEVVVNYMPEDIEIKQFLHGVQVCANNGTKLDFNVKVDYNGFMDGFKIKKQFTKALSDISLNEVIKLMVLSQSNTDRKLEELLTMCVNRD